MTEQATAHKDGFEPLKQLTRMTAIVPGALALWWWLDYPAYHMALAVLGVGYAVLLSFRPLAWIAILPALLPVVDLTMWTGRFFFTVFDFAVLITLASLWGRAQFDWPALWRRRAMMVLALSVAIGLMIGLTSPPPYEGLAPFADYNSPVNALRVAKGFIWAWLLWAAWETARNTKQAAPHQAHQLLAGGIAIGLIATGLAVFWERGVFATLFHEGGLYTVATAILDMSTAERATGLFADMHVGGAALDRYLALTVPYALATALAARPSLLKATALAATVLGGYAAAVSFSRGVLFAIAAAAILVAVQYVTRHTMIRPDKRSLTLAALGAAIYFLAMLTMRDYGGLQGQAVLALAPAALAAVTVQGIPRPLRIAVATVVGALLLWVIGDGMGESKWRTPLSGVELMTALAVTAIVLVALAGAAWVAVDRLGYRRTVVGLGLAGLLIGAAAFVGSSYRLEARLSESPEDLDTRWSHWEHGFSLNEADGPSLLIGEGLGSFPRRYFASHLGARAMPTYRIDSAGETKRLILGAGEFQMAQRVDLTGRRFPLKLSIRLGDNIERPRMGVSLCRRNIITQVRGGNQCERGQPRPDLSGQPGVIAKSIGGERLGPDGLGKLPATLRIGNGSNTAMAVEAVSLVDADGTELLRNGSFEQGLDFWIFVSDFDHLPWHAKNIWLHLFVEQGLFGVLAFTFALVLALRRSLTGAAAGDWHSLALAGALLGFALTGIFTTLVNVPRVAFLAYFQMFLGLGKTELDQTPHNGEDSA